MRILWVCNIVLPVVAKHLNMEVSNKEGWLTGLSEQILKKQESNEIEFAVACPIPEGAERFKCEVPACGTMLLSYGFCEDVSHPENYSAQLEMEIKEIIDDFRPDVVHCFGTEFAHTLAVSKVCPKEKVLVGIQGLCKLYAEAYLADLPENVVKRVTLRDFLKKDSIPLQKEKFIARGKREVETLQGVGNVTGRTWIDKAFTAECNGNLKYFFMNETLRSNFYEGRWELSSCEKYSMFLSQGDYPIKGLHYMLKAMPDILKEYPEAKVYVAGNSIVRYGSFKDRLKVSSYGKYIMQLIKDLGLEDKVVFLGRLNSDEMKAQLLKSNMFICPSVIENSPNSLGEAMLLGVPCVTAMVGGIKSIFTEGRDGIGYPGYGAEEYRDAADKESAQAANLAKAVCRMLSDEEKMLGYTQSAKEHAQNTHDGVKNYERLVEIYKEMAGK